MDPSLKLQAELLDSGAWIVQGYKARWRADFGILVLAVSLLFKHAEGGRSQCGVYACELLALFPKDQSETTASNPLSAPLVR